jgi:arylsulfatase A-like enzyme
LALFAFHSFSSLSSQEKPNIVLMLVDDLGWMDLSCQGSDFYETPNIDRLAKKGVRFDNGYAACAVCSPSRAAVQTGRYPHKTGVTDWIRSRFQGGKIPENKANPCWKPQSEWLNTNNKKKKLLVPHNALWLEKDEITLAELLKPAGYTSCFVGKWHLGADDWYPTKQGFDYNFGGCDYGQPPSYFDPYNNPKHRHEHIRKGIPGLPGRKAGEYLSDREADEAVAFIEKHHKKPFFLMLANYAVHTPIQAKADVTEKYVKKYTDQKQSNAKYAAMVESVDDAMGKIMKTLDRLELTDNTLVIFTSDNGGLSKVTNNEPLRSGKGYAYEGGLRVPFIAKWPQKIKPDQVLNTPVISMDIFPTLAHAAGLENMPVKSDGLDIVQLMQKPKQRNTLYWHFPHYRHSPGPYSIIREGDWKLIKWYEGPKELYNLKEDLSESKDLSKQMPEKVAHLEKKLMAHLKQNTDRIPVPNPDYVAK